MNDSERCRICEAETIAAGSQKGTLQPIWYNLRHCPSCRFSFVANPRTDFEHLYSADYYAGKGADPLVDYLFELEHPEESIRVYEWQGILRIVASLVPIGPETQWLDFGCGNGGLVRFGRKQTGCRLVGFEEGWIKDQAVGRGIPILDAGQLDELQGTFDVVTAIEVLEHVEDPVGVLKAIRRLLKPGGLFFYTTGNAEPFRGRLPSWRYVRPEIHISFYEPATLVRALTLAGFQPEFKGFLPGFTEVIRFKMLKNFRVRRHSPVSRLVPWQMLARLVDRRLRVTAHPIGWANPGSPASSAVVGQDQYAAK